jgi:hypothetical protein
LLTSCERIYDLTVENHLQQEVTVTIGWFGYQVRPCSVQIHRNVTGGRLVSVEVKDADGGLLYSAKEEPQVTASGIQELLVRIPSEGPGECPEPVIGQFMLVVENYTWEEVVVWLGEREVGRVPATATERLGPLPGTWMTARATLRILSLAGEELDTTMLAYYDLGKVPEFNVAAHPQ